MKVRLATQLLRESTACALKICQDDFQLTSFKHCSGTIEFISIFNNLFDIFNSRNFRQFGFKQPISEKNYNKIFDTLDKTSEYIKNLKYPDGTLIIQSQRKTGFIGFLICINSLKEMFVDIVIKNSLLSYIPTYKISQDHLEILFSKIRAQGEFNNNPTARQFKAAYKKILIHFEFKPSSSGNCIPLEEINILHCSSNKNKINAIDIINLSSKSFRTSDLDNIDTIDIPEDTDHTYFHSPTEITEFSKNIITYISGFVVRKLKKQIHCTECVGELETLPENLLKTTFFLIEAKDKGGLTYPSDNVIHICTTCEKILRLALLVSGGVYLKKKISILYLVSSVLKHYLNYSIFQNLISQINDQSPFENHIIQLTRAISEQYFTVRLHYLAKKAVDVSESTRQLSNKLVLFKGY